MRHLLRGRKLKRTSSHRHALLRNLAMELFEHKKIETTEAKAKELRPYAEKLISKAKNALKREKQNLLVEGQKIDIHNRRIVAKHIYRKAVIQELFDSIAPMVLEREGGYTRIVKTGFRRGDGADTAIIELVDWSAPKDGASKMRKRRKQQPKPASKHDKVAKAEFVAKADEVEEDIVDETEDAVVEDSVQEQTENTAQNTEEALVAEALVEEASVEETPVEEAPVVETPVDEVPAAEAQMSNTEESKQEEASSEEQASDDLKKEE